MLYDYLKLSKRNNQYPIYSTTLQNVNLILKVAQQTISTFSNPLAGGNVTFLIRMVPFIKHDQDIRTVLV